MIDLNHLSLISATDNVIEVVFYREKYPKKNFNMGMISKSVGKKVIRIRQKYIEYVGTMVANKYEEVKIEIELLPLMSYTPIDQ